LPNCQKPQALGVYLRCGRLTHYITGNKTPAFILDHRILICCLVLRFTVHFSFKLFIYRVEMFLSSRLFLVFQVNSSLTWLIISLTTYEHQLNTELLSDEGNTLFAKVMFERTEFYMTLLIAIYYR